MKKLLLFFAIAWVAVGLMVAQEIDGTTLK